MRGRGRSGKYQGVIGRGEELKDEREEEGEEMEDKRRGRGRE